LFVVVSNNQRNRNLDSALGVRLTTSSKPPISSIVAIPSSENFTGYVVCDDITEIWEDEVLAVVGGFTPATMQAVNRGLAAALGMD
jgi:mRNA interferase MazF